MPDRINPEHPKRVELMLVTGTVGVVFLTVIVIWSLLTGNPEAEQINAKLDRQLAEQRASQNANACTGYLNHRAIEDAIKDVVRSTGLPQTQRRVLPSDETRRACKAAGIPIDDEGDTIEDSHR